MQSVHTLVSIGLQDVEVLRSWGCLRRLRFGGNRAWYTLSLGYLLHAQTAFIAERVWASDIKGGISRYSQVDGYVVVQSCIVVDRPNRLMICAEGAAPGQNRSEQGGFVVVGVGCNAKTS